MTACLSNHLTSFATGFMPEINVVDFDFIYAGASFQDNITIFLTLIICFLIFISMTIWSLIRDRKDAANV